MAGQRQSEDRAFRAFAERYGLHCAAADPPLPLRGDLDGVPLAIAKVERGQARYPWPVTQFLAAAPTPIPGGVVAYKPNFRWRFGGPRRIQDSLGAGGLFGFAHHDSVGDPELDKKLVIYADDVPFARVLLTAPGVKRAILSALAAAGHIRVHESQVALEVSERRRGAVRLLASVEEVASLARAATDVARALSAAASGVAAKR